MATYLNTRLEDLYKQYNGAPDTLPNLNEKNVDAQTFYHSQALELAISPIKSQLPNIVFLYFTGLNGLFGNIMLLYTGFGIIKTLWIASRQFLEFERQSEQTYKLFRLIHFLSSILCLVLLLGVSQNARVASLITGSMKSREKVHNSEAVEQKNNGNEVTDTELENFRFHKWQTVASLFDYLDDASFCCRQNIDGYLVLLNVLGGMWWLASCIDIILLKNGFSEFIFLAKLKENLIPCIVLSFLIKSLLIVDFGLVKLYLNKKSFSSRTLLWTNKFAEVVYYICLVKYLRLRNYDFTVAKFLCIMYFIYLMKSHAYVYSVIKLKNYFPKQTSKLNKLQTFSRLVRFIYIPTLVYEIDFPRSTGKFRKKYFFLKLISTITVFNIYIYLIYYKYPDLMRAQSQNHLITLITSYCSILIESVILIFLFMFDGILNLLAEATRFPDRQFYGFWWNSTTFIEFSRDWNTPVYRWLHVYIYKASLGYFKKHNKILSVLLTLTVSGILHELFLFVLFGSFNFYISLLTLSQIPLSLTVKYFKGSIYGKIFFWTCITLGITLLAICYNNSLN